MEREGFVLHVTARHQAASMVLVELQAWFLAQTKGAGDPLSFSGEPGHDLRLAAMQAAFEKEQAAELRALFIAVADASFGKYAMNAILHHSDGKLPVSPRDLRGCC
jgi:hypothetical protein